VAIAIQLRSTI